MKKGSEERKVEGRIMNCLHKYAEKFPDKAAYIFCEREGEEKLRINFAELELRVRKLASRLFNKKLEGSRVILFYEEAHTFIISFLACIYSGAIPVPVPFARRNRQIARLFGIIEDAEPAAVLCPHEAVLLWQQSLAEMKVGNSIEIIPTDYTEPLYPIRLIQKPIYNVIAFIQYTSGSTGQPKGVIVTQRNLMHNQLAIKETFRCTERSVIFSWLPFYHDMGLVGNILHGLYSGCTCIIMSPLHFIEKPVRWLEAISKYSVTHSGGPNFAYDLCVDRISATDLTELDLSSWSVAYNGSEPVWAATIQRFAQHFKGIGFQQKAFHPCYGLAEATLLVTGHRKKKKIATINLVAQDENGQTELTAGENKNSSTLVSSGKPAPGMQVKIVGLQHQRECGEQELGEIYIAGESVTPGYWKKDNSLLTRRIGEIGYLPTGDLGLMHRGELFVRGRIKEMLIIRGQNYYPYDVEHLVGQVYPGIEKNAVSVFSRKGREDEMIIVAELKREAITNTENRKVISDIDSVVTEIFGISPYDILLTMPVQLPRTTSGKLQRVKCKELYEKNGFATIATKLQQTNRDNAKERNPVLLQQVLSGCNKTIVAKYVVDIIQSKTGQTIPGIPDGSFALTSIGIDSLRAMEIINLINKELQINLDAAGILRQNSFNLLIDTIENLLWLKSNQSSGKEIII